ncbi:hypothetical protein CRM94_38065 [Burkholderia gladioli]|uniref:Uncharacterized protein n=1 Tax=Burkholderia gladioli TaxID=28095 RepID=A0A2A7S9A2_BURGA|nr:hypothetical protein CRM94_38065 [Burkholderia gladioli]
MERDKDKAGKERGGRHGGVSGRCRARSRIRRAAASTAWRSARWRIAASKSPIRRRCSQHARSEAWRGARQDEARGDRQVEALAEWQDEQQDEQQVDRQVEPQDEPQDEQQNESPVETSAGSRATSEQQAPQAATRPRRAPISGSRVPGSSAGAIDPGTGCVMLFSFFGQTDPLTPRGRDARGRRNAEGRV